MKDIKSIIKDLRTANVRLLLSNGNIQVEGNPTAELLADIRANKEELVAYLQKSQRTPGFSRINPIGRQDSYVLSSSQRRLWILSQFEEINITYNIAKVFLVEGALDKALLSAAFARLIERHESLRTVFITGDDGEPRQVIISPEKGSFEISYRDLRAMSSQETAMQEVVKVESLRPFDLSSGPLLRAALCQLSENKWMLIYVMHHIISDAWSMGILIRELLSSYGNYAAGNTVQVSPLRIQYKDYAAWQQEQLNNEAVKAQRNYWLQQFEGELPVLEMPADAMRPPIKTYNGGVINRLINARLSKGIKSLGQEQGCTLFMGLLAAVYTLLYRYSHQEDIIIGTPVAGREHIDLEEQIGFYINTLALRAKFKGTNTFNELLAIVKQITLGAFAHQIYPFDELVTDLNPRRDMSRNMIFDVMVMLQNTKIDKKEEAHMPGDISISSYESAEQLICKFDLAFGFMETGEEIYLGIEYNSDIYTEKSIARLADHFEQLLEVLIATPDNMLQQLDFLQEKEQQQLLVDFNSSDITYDNDETVLSLFARQVKDKGDLTALVFQDKQLSYRELDELSNQFSNYLLEKYNIVSDDLVCLKLPRSEWMIVALLGILKCGAAYVPVDLEYPEERISYMIADSQCKSVIDEEMLNNFIGSQQQYDPYCQAPMIDLQHAAYVIYTSGSTGLPKGCVITHANLAAYIQWANSYYFSADHIASFGLYTSISFDLTVTSIFCPLTQGGKLHIYDSGEELSAVFTHTFSTESGINSIKLTPSHIQLLQQLDLKSSAVTCAIVGGEEVSTSDVNILKNINPAMRVYNEYGPTETTVGCVVKELLKDEPVLIGKPVAHAAIYILDAAGMPCPIGVTGEIYIGGSSVAKGYLHKDSLTMEKFVPHPFMPGERLYRSGDIGKWLPNGEIDFMGRKDEQVKIRGYRIEPGEIKNALLQHPDITGAEVIVVTGKTGAKELAAYVTGNADITAGNIRSYLLQSLPAYMIPEHFVQLREMPLNKNGKTDRRQLPHPAGKTMRVSAEYLAPRNDGEEKMVNIWKELLQQEKIGVRDDFFELGGNSLKATKLLALIHRQFNVQMKLQELFIKTTIEEISKEISRKLWAQQPEVEQQPDLVSDKNFIL